MGNWKLEVGKMAVYMSLPVALFHIFNQPTYFEEWVTKKRREIYPPENVQDRENVQKLIQEMKRRESSSYSG